ncbi:MAG TPA: hypothetical protein DCZ07_05675 [Alphaproteobacteria bacterium]|nr:hypothetical protein [Alphaproteobacteria bacterium]
MRTSEKVIIGVFPAELGRLLKRPFFCATGQNEIAPVKPSFIKLSDPAQMHAQQQENGPKLQVFMARDDAARDRVFAFRYRVLVEASGLQSDYADHEAKTVREPLDHGALQIYVADMQSGETAAALRLNAGALDSKIGDIGKMAGFGPFKEFSANALTMTSMLVIAPKYQTSSAASLAISAAYKMARKCGSLFDFTQCAPEMLPLYQKLGYRKFRDNFMDDTLGYQVPLVLVTQDYGHLTFVRSPLGAIARKMTNSSETASWFNRTFPDYANVPIESTLNDEDFWYLLARKLNQSPLAGIALLDGLTYSEAIEFMRAGSVLDCPAGGRIMKKGQIGREMYVILSGAVKVLAGADDAVVARLEKGELFGELAYLSESPRTADIIADEDVELLVLTQKMMEKALAEMPAIAARILFNLSLILCGRLKNSTAVLVSAAQGQKSDASAGEAMPESPEIAEAG